MSELNREQIIKALECCLLSNEHQEEECNECPFDECPTTICQNLLAYHALALIKKLAEENKEIGIKNFDLICELSRIEADTVRKMQERLMAKAYYPKPYGMVKVIDEYDIYQVAKEMEGE